MTRLPGILGLGEELAGREAAQRLALRRGGTEIKLSRHPKGVLAQIVGEEAAAKIVDALGPEKVTVPMAHLRGQKGRRAAAAKMLASGASANAVAQACDIHERTARRVRERLKSDLPLFPED